MPLTNRQIDRIEQIYYERRKAAEDKAAENRVRIEKTVPEYARLEEEQAELRSRLIEAKRAGSERLAASLDKQIRATVLMKETLLQEAGFSPEELKPQWTCPICRDTGYTEEGKCSCFRPTLVNVLYHDSPLWSRVNEESFETFDITRFGTRPEVELGGDSARSVMIKNLRAAKNFVRNFGTKMQNMLLYGPTGTGKTFLCNCIAGALMKEGWAVVYMTAAEYFRLMADIAFGRSEQTIEGLMDSTDLLIIDDLGTEIETAANVSLLEETIDRRFRRKQSTVISTNLTPEDIRHRYIERIGSRLMGYQTLPFGGDDLRTQARSRITDL